MNVAFSYRGLEALDAPDVEAFAGPQRFGTPFSVGLERRAAALGDVAAGCGPSTWVTGERTPHVLLQLGTDASDEFDALRAAYGGGASSAEALAARGVRVVHADVARRLDAIGSEQFGFHDAVSNPAPRGFFADGRTPISPRTHAGDREHALPGQDLVHPGEFVLLRDAARATAFGPRAARATAARAASNETWAGKYASSRPDWAKNGAFLVNRRLRQDVAGFWAWCAKEAAAEPPAGGAPLTQEALAAKLFGRWPSGCPLARCAFEDLPALGADPTREQRVRVRRAAPRRSAPRPATRSRARRATSTGARARSRRTRAR